MSMSTVVRRVTFDGAATPPEPTATEFPVAFPFFQQSDLKLTRILLAGTLVPMVLNVDYTVSGEGRSSGGAVKLTLELGSDEDLVIERIVAPKQETDLSNLGSAYPEVVESGLDYQAQLSQQHEDLLGAFDPTHARVPKLGENEIDGSGAYDARSNKISNMANGVATQDAATVGQITGLIGGIIVASSGVPGAFTQYAGSPPTADSSLKNVIIVVRYATGPSVAMICLEQATGGTYDWNVI